MITHIDRVHRGKRFKCKLCQFAFSTKNSVQRHVPSIHNQECTNDEFEIVYVQIAETLPQNDQDAIIDSQTREIKDLEAKLKKTKTEIKKMRDKLKIK